MTPDQLTDEEKGAAAKLLGSMPLTAFAANAEDAGSNRMEMYSKEFEQALERIQKNRLVASRTRNRLGNIYAGSQEDSNNDRKLPLFRRNMSGYPGSESMTE